MSDTEVTQES